MALNYFHQHVTLDLLAVIWFLGLWSGYAYVADVGRSNHKTLVKIMHRYRLQWVKQMIRRPDRLVDIRMVGNLLSTTTFLASTSVLLIGGFVAVLGYGERALPILAEVPFAVETTLSKWTFKTIFMLVIFVYAFFKFTWVIRQFNFIAALMLAAPVYVKGDQLEEVKRETLYVTRVATLLTNSARHFNAGIRAYYFGVVALGWYVSPLLFMFLTALVVVVLYRREFMSRTYIELL